MKDIRIVLKFFVILATIFCLISCAVGVVEAEYDWKTQINDLDEKEGDRNLNNTASNIMGSIISVVRIVATGVALIMIVFVAMKYMTSAPGERAEIKKHAVPFVVGAIVLFASSGILGIIQGFASKNIK